jgi:hypothetical protein
MPRQVSSRNSDAPNIPSPAPPNSSGIETPVQPSSAIFA